MKGQHFCVSFAAPNDADFAAAFGQSVLYDNGAFSVWKRGIQVDETGLYQWLERRLQHPHRAICLDRIDGDVEEQRAMLKRWPFPKELSWPVWHLDKPLEYLDELIDQWPSGVCLGSAGAYAEIGTEAWIRRMDSIFELLHRRYVRLPWIHGLRMLGQIANYPLASADSTNVAQNYGIATGCAHCHAKQINSVRRKRGASLRRPTMDLFMEPSS